MKFLFIFPLIFFAMDLAHGEQYPELGVKVDIIAEDLSVPWSIDFAPDGRIFFSERSGALNILDGNSKIEILNLDVGGGEGGLLGITLDPNFDENHYVYIFYTYNDFLEIKNKLVRFVEKDNKLSEEKILLDGIPGSPWHDGGRIKFGPDGKLYITTGDAINPALSQDVKSVGGKILRINSDGSIPEDNPFGSAIYSIGHRNPQGITWDKFGNLIATEHGPSGFRGSAHDEVNLIISGQNYGWPDVIGDEVKDGAINPILHSGEITWAPSGTDFYYGNEMPIFVDKLLIATLKGEHIHFVEFDESFKIQSDGEIFSNEFGRLRDIVEGPDGLYILTSNQDGRGNPNLNDDKILRISSMYDFKNSPIWVQNISKWYLEDKITKQDAIFGISYLVKNEILKSY